MSQKSADVNNQQTVRRYFNIGQGGASTNVVLDAIALSKVFGKVKKSRLIIEPEEKQNDDRIKQRRDAYTFLNDIEERIEVLLNLNWKMEKLSFREYMMHLETMR